MVDGLLLGYRVWGGDFLGGLIERKGHYKEGRRWRMDMTMLIRREEKVEEQEQSREKNSREEEKDEKEEGRKREEESKEKD